MIQESSHIQSSLRTFLDSKLRNYANSDNKIHDLSIVVNFKVPLSMFLCSRFGNYIKQNLILDSWSKELSNYKFNNELTWNNYQTREEQKNSSKTS